LPPKCKWQATAGQRGRATTTIMKESKLEHGDYLTLIASPKN